MFLHVFKKKIFNFAVKTPINVEENIYSITMKILEGKIEWVVNEKFFWESQT